MDNTRADGNLTSNNNSEMVDKFDDCTGKEAWVNETVVSAGFINEKPCDTDNKQGNIPNYGSIKNENIDNLMVVVGEPDLITDCTDDEMCPNETVISGGHVKQEPCDMKHGSIQNYLCIKDENIDDLTVITQETELMTDYVDNKVCLYETIISGGYIKEEPCDTEDESGNITHHNVIMKGCEECGEQYDLYCLKCSTLIRIFDSNNPDGRDNTVRWTLPKNFIDICETPSGVGIIALRIIPKGVVFGPFRGLDSNKDDTVSKWKLKNKELVYTKDPGWLNWMQYVRMTDQSSHQNLVPFQYQNGLYYRSNCHISVGDELLVCWDSDNKGSEIQDMEDSYWEPRVCESLDNSYACTFCCVGYKSLSHLKAHNSTCIEKRNRNDYCEEIVQCDICKFYLDKKEYADYHMDRCYKSNEKCVSNSGCRRNRRGPLQHRIHNGNRPFSCTHCPYKATTKAFLKQHIAIHNDDKPFVCTHCPYKTTRKSDLKQHIAVHNDDRPFACSLCSYKATTNSKLKQHVAIHNDKPFACALCPFKTTTNWQLNQHVAIHNDDKPFACTLCPYKTTRKSILERHVVVHNDDRPFACPFCSYKTNTNLALKRHIVTHNDDRPFACTLCPYKAKTQPVLKHHIAAHYDDRPFACALCPYKAKTKSFLRQHILIHNGDKPFACTLCPYKTMRKAYLKQHMAIHNDDRPFACPLCPYKATTNSKLKQHVAIHNDKPFTCALCPFKTTTNWQLNHHVAIHNDDKAFACTLCPYKTTKKSILKQHMAVHSDDRPFGCSLCSYKANTSLTLKRHVATHSDDRPFACALCPYKAKIQSVLKHHIATHNRVKPFACTFCTYTTTVYSTLKRHIATHSDDRPFVCTLCPYKATTSSNLKRHVASHNK